MLDRKYPNDINDIYGRIINRESDMRRNDLNCCHSRNNNCSSNIKIPELSRIEENDYKNPSISDYSNILPSYDKNKIMNFYNNCNNDISCNERLRIRYIGFVLSTTTYLINVDEGKVLYRVFGESCYRKLNRPTTSAMNETNNTYQLSFSSPFNNSDSFSIEIFLNDLVNGVNINFYYEFEPKKFGRIEVAKENINFSYGHMEDILDENQNLILVSSYRDILGMSYYSIVETFCKEEMGNFLYNFLRNLKTSGWNNSAIKLISNMYDLYNKKINKNICGNEPFESDLLKSIQNETYWCNCNNSLNENHCCEPKIPNELPKCNCDSYIPVMNELSIKVFIGTYLDGCTGEFVINDDFSYSLNGKSFSDKKVSIKSVMEENLKMSCYITIKVDNDKEITFKSSSVDGYSSLVDVDHPSNIFYKKPNISGSVNGIFKYTNENKKELSLTIKDTISSFICSDEGEYSCNIEIDKETYNIIKDNVKNNNGYLYINTEFLLENTSLYDYSTITGTVVDVVSCSVLANSNDNAKFLLSNKNGNTVIQNNNLYSRITDILLSEETKNLTISRYGKFNLKINKEYSDIPISFKINISIKGSE